VTSRITYSQLSSEKRVPLTISRGTSTHSEILWLRWEEESVEGWGEAAPFDIGDRAETLDEILAALKGALGWLSRSSAWQRLAIEARLRAEGAPSALIAGLNQALLDWLGRKLGCPVWRLLGLTPENTPLTSVTVGISKPDAAQQRVRLWREAADVRSFKLKLGSPEGIGADQAMFEAARAEIGAQARISVDANGGWSIDDACRMAGWLHERGLDYLEQPLARSREADLGRLRQASPLPIIADESCRDSSDVARLSGLVDGINIKLMKSGGIDEALRMIATARAHGLRILIGCYGSTALGNTAAAALGPLADYLDLDSHLNLKDDPFRGVQLVAGRLILPSAPGFGVTDHGSH
jgi:L-Ala-D/L-Glu epimerase